MKHPIYSIISFKIVSPYTLQVEFNDSIKQEINFLPVLKGELYTPLRDLTLFNQVQLDPEVRKIVWPNGADFDPATLHDWPENKARFERMANKWEEKSSVPVSGS